jgi:hypothetical protein
MSAKANLLLQTTIPSIEDDWHIGRFSLLADHLRSLTDEKGQSLYDVTTRDRESDAAGNDQLLSGLDRSGFDVLWLFGVDDGNGLSEEDCAGITRFRNRGGGIFSTRDHADLGVSLCTLGGVGAAHYFHTKNPDPDPTRHRRDDQMTPSVDFPNYHSGANGDYQLINIEIPHDVFRRPGGSFLEFFPAHPHEGGVGAPPEDTSARVIATSTSLATGRKFNLVVAFESSDDGKGTRPGRAIAQSSFHHLVDYNWDIDAGCPSFVEEAPGNGYKRHPEALDDIKQYVENVARWLAS